MGKRRGLTDGEIALARAAFGERIGYRKVKLSDGPGNHPFAQMAFAKGNPAITIGSTIYFKRDYCPDFSAPGRNRRCFIHEMAHVWQYQTLGMPKFVLRYGEDFARVGGRAADMYEYDRGRTKFAAAMIEAQAEMVGDYGEALWSSDEEAMASVARNLAGSGLYGL